MSTSDLLHINVTACVVFGLLDEAGCKATKAGTGAGVDGEGAGIMLGRTSWACMYNIEGPVLCKISIEWHYSVQHPEGKLSGTDEHLSDFRGYLLSIERMLRCRK